MSLEPVYLLIPLAGIAAAIFLIVVALRRRREYSGRQYVAESLAI